MFSSISKATPLTVRTTSFVATRPMTIVPVSEFVIKVNGVVTPNPLLVSVQSGDTVTAEITTPGDWLWHAFYSYQIDGVPCSFAVVNKSNYTISVKPADANKRWYMYEPQNHTASFQFLSGTNYAVNLGTNYEPIPSEYHVLLNPLDSSVYFYNNNGIQISKVVVPAQPIDYVKIPDKQSVVILVRGGEAYEIKLDNSTAGLAPFYARLNYSEFTDENFVFQLPGEDLITYLRRLRAKEAIPPATCITYDGMFAFAAGNGSVWVMDPYANYNLVNQYDIDEFVLNMAPLPNNTGIILITQSQRVYKMTYNGTFTQLYQGTALWQPALFNNKIYIPEGQVGLLKVYNPATNNFEPDILLDDFSPSYTYVDGGKMYVAGHDSERVLVFDSAMNVTERIFGDKVSLISAISGNILASHWMKSFKVLNLGDLRRIVAVEFRSRRGPVSHVGTSAVVVKTLGNDEVFARTPLGTWLWVNGQRAYSEDVRGTMLIDDDIISINLSCKFAGLQRTNCIIGDVVYDYDVEAVAQTYYPRQINLPILPPGNFGVHTRTINLPNFFTPCLMSIEYGVIKVNGALYYGNEPVTAGDVVTIEIETKNKSILPVFTVGSRQFVIPVSTNLVLTPIEFVEYNVNPGVYITQEFTFTESQTLYDYIIPGYYDITIKKNDVDITGNYFQQFGVGDTLSVAFASSPKLYDSSDVYILGSKNYRFTIQNELGTPINYLDYGNVIYPYARQKDPYAESTSSYFVSSWYGNAINYVVPNIQFFSANIVISGVPVSSGQANISVVGGDSYFILDGNIQSDTNIQVWNGNNLAIARNVLSYFDSNVTIVQHLPTGDEDGFADVVVGNWGILNRAVEPINSYNDRNTVAAAPTNELSYSSAGGTSAGKFLVALEKTAQRNLISAYESLEYNNLTVDLASSSNWNDYKIIESPALTEEIFSTQTIEILDNSKSTIKIQQFDFATHTQSTIKKDITVQRNLFESILYFDPSHLITDSQSLISFLTYQDPTIDSYKINFNYNNMSAVDSSVSEHLSFRKAMLGTLSLEFLKHNVRIVLESTNLRSLPNALVFYDLLPMFNFSGRTKGIKTAESEYTSDTYSMSEQSNAIFAQQDFWSNIDTLEVTQISNQSTIGDATAVVKKETTDFIGTNINYEISVSSEFISNVSQIDRPTAINFLPSFLSADKFDAGFTNVFDSFWASTGFQGDLLLGNPAAAKENSDHFVNDTVFNKVLQRYYETRPSSADRMSFRYREAKDISWSLLRTTATTDRTIMQRSELDKIPTDVTNPDVVNDINYIRSRTVEAVEYQTSVAVSQEYVYGNSNFTIGETIPDFSNKEYTMVGVSYGMTVSNNYMIVNTVAGINSLEKPMLNNIIGLAAGLQSLFVVETTADAEDFNPVIGMDYVYNIDEQSVEKLNFTTPWSHQLATHSSSGSYGIENTERGGLVKPTYSRDQLLSTISYMQYARSPQVSETYIKPVWKNEEYSIEPLVIYRLERETPNLQANAKMIFEHDNPQLYFTAQFDFKVDPGVVWDHDISTVYGAFETAQDAIDAASRYSSFRPQLIFDTNLWTYRVLLDTGLVCPLPAGRYPIAWLMRGG